MSESSDFFDSHARFSQVRETSDEALARLKKEIKDLKELMNENWKKIRRAEKKGMSCQHINQLHRERTNLCRRLKRARKELKKTKNLINSTRRDRETASTIYVNQQRRIYNTSFSRNA